MTKFNMAAETEKSTHKPAPADQAKPVDAKPVEPAKVNESQK